MGPALGEFGSPIYRAVCPGVRLGILSAVVLYRQALIWQTRDIFSLVLNTATNSRDQIGCFLLTTTRIGPPHPGFRPPDQTTNISFRRFVEKGLSYFLICI